MPIMPESYQRGERYVAHAREFSIWALKGHSQLWDRADLDTSLPPKSMKGVGYI